MTEKPVYFRIKKVIQELLQDFVDLEGEGNTSGIKRTSIVLRHFPYEVNAKTWGNDETTPGILISGSRKASVPAEGGNNREDDIYYPVHLQIIDSNSSRLDEAKMESWDKWAENIRKFFNQMNLRKQVFTEAGYVDQVFVSTIDPLDDRAFTIHNKCVYAIVLEVKSREPHNREGSV